MATASLGLAETVLGKKTQSKANLSRYRTRIISEEPRFRTIRLHGELYTVPLPYIHYLLVQVNKPRMRSWSLLSVYASPRHLTSKRFRRVSRPPLPNLYTYTPLFKPCQNARSLRSTDANKLIVNFWSGNFNYDLGYATDVTNKIATESYSRRFSKEYMNQWEKYSLQEMLNMPWEQDVKI